MVAVPLSAEPCGRNNAKARAQATKRKGEAEPVASVAEQRQPKLRHAQIVRKSDASADAAKQMIQAHTSGFFKSIFKSGQTKRLVEFSTSRLFAPLLLKFIIR